LAATQVGGQYEGFRIANTADADFFIGSLFGTNADDCSTLAGVLGSTNCGTLAGWIDGLFGGNASSNADVIFFKSHVSGAVGTIVFWHDDLPTDPPYVAQTRAWNTFAASDVWSDLTPGALAANNVSWLLVKDTVASVPEPSIIALMSLGIFGIRFARRRRQS
jgi:hypothetical protein